MLYNFYSQVVLRSVRFYKKHIYRKKEKEGRKGYCERVKNARNHIFLIDELYYIFVSIFLYSKCSCNYKSKFWIHSRF